MQGMKKASLEFLSILGVVFCLISILQYVDCDKKATDSYNQNQYKRLQPHGHGQASHKSSESEEDDIPISAPEILGFKGLASTGIAYWRPSGSVPKCLGYDLRLEKISQVTRYCEEDTGEGQHETGVTAPRSLCFTACMFKMIGLIGEDLMFTSNIDAVVVDIFPSVAHTQAKRAFRGCARQAHLPLSIADNCTSFGPVKGCILRNVQNICNGEYD